MLGCEQQFSHMEEEELKMLIETLDTLVLIKDAELKPLGITHIQVDGMQYFYQSLLTEAKEALVYAIR